MRQYRDIRVILMSASIDTALFTNYFGDCPNLQLQGRTFSVQCEFSAYFFFASEYELISLMIIKKGRLLFVSSSFLIWVRFRTE